MRTIPIIFSLLFLLPGCSSAPEEPTCTDRGMKFCPVGSDVRCEKDEDGCIKCVCTDKKRP